MISIAHRGLWTPDRRMENSFEAIHAAVAAGYGLELDVRLGIDGRLWLQHAATDMPYLLDGANGELLKVVETLRAAPVVMWDIKEVRVLAPLAAWLAGQDLLTNAVFFDLEIAKQVAEGRGPAAPVWRDAWEGGAPYLRRASETESLYDALGDGQAAGVWLDAWEREWVNASVIRTVQAVGKKAYVCSPELHHRPLDLALWREWAGADGIVTDFPHLLAALARPELRPAGWHADEEETKQ